VYRSQNHDVDQLKSPLIEEWEHFHQGCVKLLSASVKRFKVSLQPASGRGIQRWRPTIGVFCLFCFKIGLIILIDYINFAYLDVLLTKECIIELILLSFRKKLNLFTKVVYKQIV